MSNETDGHSPQLETESDYHAAECAAGGSDFDLGAQTRLRDMKRVRESLLNLAEQIHPNRYAMVLHAITQVEEEQRAGNAPALSDLKSSDSMLFLFLACQVAMDDTLLGRAWYDLGAALGGTLYILRYMESWLDEQAALSKSNLDRQTRSQKLWEYAGTEAKSEFMTDLRKCIEQIPDEGRSPDGVLNLLLAYDETDKSLEETINEVLSLHLQRCNVYDIFSESPLFGSEVFNALFFFARVEAYCSSVEYPIGRFHLALDRLTESERDIVMVLADADERMSTKQILAELENRRGAASEGTAKGTLSMFQRLGILENQRGVYPHGYELTELARRCLGIT